MDTTTPSALSPRQRVLRTALTVVFATAILGGAITGVLWALPLGTPDAPPSAQEIAIAYDGVAGVDAFTLLERGHRVEAKDFGASIGKFVEAIDGVRPDASSFWSFRVNGEAAAVGASQYVTKDGDRITWRIERIVPQ